MKETQNEVNNEMETPVKETIGSKTPQSDGNKETKYCTLLQSVKIDDKETGYTYAFEKSLSRRLKEKKYVCVCIRICVIVLVR